MHENNWNLFWILPRKTAKESPLSLVLEERENIIEYSRGRRKVPTKTWVLTFLSPWWEFSFHALNSYSRPLLPTNPSLSSHKSPLRLPTILRVLNFLWIPHFFSHQIPILILFFSEKIIGIRIWVTRSEGWYWSSSSFEENPVLFSRFLCVLDRIDRVVIDLHLFIARI